MGARVFRWLGVWLLVSLTAPPVHAQYFGHNKVRYEDLQFRLLQTDHFDIYSSESDQEAAQRAGRLAERWYHRLSQLLEHQLSTRQPLILYGSHPDFEQTNVVSGFLGEEIGGVTESRRRRIVMPFGLGLAESDHVLGHELVHAFQYDIAEVEGRSLSGVPLWFAEGMAEYLSSGPVDAAAAMMLRDAASEGRLPSIQTLGQYHLSPYRTGQALWAWLGGRFGDEVVGRILKARPRNVIKRIESVTGVSVADLTRDWQAAIQASGDLKSADPVGTRIVGAESGGGRLNIAPSLSPDGRHLVFLSERDRLSIDVFLADAVTGAVHTKLVTTAANPQFDSLQFLSSAGAWSPDGGRLLLATVRRSRPVLSIFDVASGRREREIVIDSLDQVFHPSWSPDGRLVAFTGLSRGQSDLYQYDLDAARLAPLTNDAYTDFQPVWSPDGRQIAFATDRFTTTLSDLHFGPYRLALLDVDDSTIGEVEGLPSTATVDPQWAPDGRSLYFRAAPAGISNVMRVDLASHTSVQITDDPTSVVGVTSLSPSLSVARASDRIAYTVYRNGRYEIWTHDRPAGLPSSSAHLQSQGGMLPGAKIGRVANLLADAESGLPIQVRLPTRPYLPDMTLDAIGQPYFSMSAGGGSGLLRGGTSFFFGDLLGDRYLGAAVQAGASLEDLAIDAQYLNRSSRWTWGGTIELTPFVRGYERRWVSDDVETPTFVRETERHRQFHLSVGGLAAYPFNRSTRIEVHAGPRAIWYQREVRSRVFGLPRRGLLSDRTVDIPAPASVTLFETSIALVRDTAVRGPVSPILGARARFEVASSLGAIPFVHTLVDYRRYWIPVRPYTLAVRALHVGRYGPGSDDPRLEPLYLGRTGLVRGYPYNTARSACEISTEDACGTLDALMGSRLLVSQLEWRVPVRGALSGQFDWGSLPIEALFFADAGTAWDTGERPPWFRGSRALFASAGAGVRLNPAGFVLEFDLARRISTEPGGWSFLFNVRPGF